MAATLTPAELQTLESLLAKLDGQGGNLPYPLFRFITEVTATANVDLLVQDDASRTLLAWRDDPFGAGWHVPGSIIRHREEIAHRIALCAQDEFGCDVHATVRPIALLQIFDDRGHSISLCYPARLLGAPGKRVIGEAETPEPGDLRWFASPPAQLYPSHLVYRDLLAQLDAGLLSAGIPILTQHTGHRDAAQTNAGGSISSDTSLA